MKSYYMEDTFADADAESEEEIIKRYEEVLNKLRERLKKKEKEDQIDAATLYRDHEQYRIHFYGNDYFNCSLERAEVLCG